MQISVKILNGAEHNVQVSPDDSVQCLKKTIERDLNIPTSQQRLMFKGKPLSDTHTLKGYSIQEGAKVHISVKKDTETTASSSLKETQQPCTSSTLTASDETTNSQSVYFKYALENTPLNRELRAFAANAVFQNTDEFVEIFNEELLKLSQELTLEQIERYNEFKWRQEHPNEKPSCHNHSS